MGHPNALDGCTAAAAGNRKGDSAIRVGAAGASRTAPDASNAILHPTQQVRQETGGTERRL